MGGGGGGVCKAKKKLNKCMKLNWNFQREGIFKKNSFRREVWILNINFSGITQCQKVLPMGVYCCLLEAQGADVSLIKGNSTNMCIHAFFFSLADTS